MFEKLKSIRDALTRTRQTAFGRIATLLGATEISPELWDDLEALLIQADCGVETTLDVLERAQEAFQTKGDYQDRSGTRTVFSKKSCAPCWSIRA